MSRVAVLSTATNSISMAHDMNARLSGVGEGGGLLLEEVEGWCFRFMLCSTRQKTSFARAVLEEYILKRSKKSGPWNVDRSETGSLVMIFILYSVCEWCDARRVRSYLCPSFVYIIVVACVCGHPSSGNHYFCRFFLHFLDYARHSKPPVPILLPSLLSIPPSAQQYQPLNSPLSATENNGQCAVHNMV